MFDEPLQDVAPSLDGHMRVSNVKRNMFATGNHRIKGRTLLERALEQTQSS